MEKDVEKNVKKLRMMRFWLVGAFLIVMIGFTTYLVMLSGIAGMGSVFASPAYWMWALGSVVLFIAAYFLYRWFLYRQN